MYKDKDTCLKTKDPFNDIRKSLKRCHHNLCEIIMTGFAD